MEPHGITAAQFKVLIIMAQFGVDTPAELCRHLSLDSGSMTRMLDRLEHKGFLARQRSEADRRQVQLVLTAQGQQLADRLPDIGAAAMNELAGAITEQELATLEQILKKILVAAGDSITLLRVGDK
jgi:MarR family multiple antibiotic resistance transcriptional regulator